MPSAEIKEKACQFASNFQTIRSNSRRQVAKRRASSSNLIGEAENEVDEEYNEETLLSSERERENILGGDNLERLEQGQSISSRVQMSITRAQALANQFSRSKRAKLSNILRSRNPIVDNWLVDEDGTDAYGDLEDFIEY